METTPKPPGFFARMILALPVVRRELNSAEQQLAAKSAAIHQYHDDNVRLRERISTVKLPLEQEIHELNEKLEDALEQLEQSKIENQKPKIQPAAGPLAADEVLDAFSVTEREPWFAATMQEIEGLIEEATRAVEAQPAAPASAEARTHAAGGLFALRDLRERLHALRETATKREDTEDKAA